MEMAIAFAPEGVPGIKWQMAPPGRTLAHSHRTAVDESENPSTDSNVHLRSSFHKPFRFSTYVREYLIACQCMGKVCTCSVQAVIK